MIATCELHGEYDQKTFDFAGTIITAQCPACVEDHLAKIEKPSQRVIISPELGIGARYADATFDAYRVTNPGQTKALQVSKRIVAGWEAFRASGRSVLFFGKSGTGKTMLASIIVREIASKIGPRKVWYGTLLKAVREIRATFGGRSGSSEQDVIDRLAGVDLLVLEEVGVQIGSPYEQATVFEVLDQRWSNKLPTIITSNLDENGIEQNLGFRIMRRFRDAESIMVAFDWDYKHAS